MKFIKISKDTLLNIAAISTIRFYEHDTLGTGTAPTRVELVADIVTLNGSKHTISGEAANELSRAIRAT